VVIVCVAPLQPQLSTTMQLLPRTFGIIAPINLRPMASTVVPLGDVVIVLIFAAAAAAAVALTLGGGGGGVCNILALLRESWV
jgi:hypothetical protein